MTEDELIRLIERGPGRKVLRALAPLSQGERRALAGPVKALFKAWLSDGISFNADGSRAKARVHEDALKVAMLATGVPSELKRHDSLVVPHEPDLTEVVGALRPSWIDRWVADMVEANPNLRRWVAPLWKAGLCARPDSDAYILGYYAYYQNVAALAEDPVFLERDVWRFFEVEGGGEFSLAAHDKYSGPDEAWTAKIAQLSARGLLDRTRLLDGALDALERDFGQFRAGWYGRLHGALEPTLDELEARRPRYARLLASMVPPTVSFALKALKTLDKAGRLPPRAHLAEIGPALHARQKATATGALQLLASAARRDPGCAPEAARLAASALIAEAADVQAKALDLVEKLGGPEDPETRDLLAAHLDTVAPSLRDRLAGLCGGLSVAPATVGTTGPVPVADPVPIDPIAGPDDALAAVLAVLESPRDPFAVERAVDGIARHGAALADAGRLSPLAKRAANLVRAPGDSAIRMALAVTGLAWTEGREAVEVLEEAVAPSGFRPIARWSFAHVCLLRNAEILRQVAAGHALPMLSAPTDTSGRVEPGTLVDRLAAYRAAGAAPGPTDLALALLRLGREGRDAARAVLTPASEAERAVAYALGKEEAPGADPGLWAAAWAARDPATADPRVAALQGGPRPDAGTPAATELVVAGDGDGDGPYYYCVADVRVEPPRCPPRDGVIASLFHTPAPNRYSAAAPCGRVYEDIAWASLVWPVHTEPLFVQAVLCMDTAEKHTDHRCVAFLEALLRPLAPVGQHAHETLAYYLASEDKAVSGLAADIVAQLACEHRLDADRFADAARRFATCGELPLRRWTAGFGAIASVGPEPAALVRRAIPRLLDDTGDAPPRDLGGTLELLYELHVAADTRPDDPMVVARLKALRGGGKIATYSKKLLALAG